MNRNEALNKAIGILTYNQVNFCKSKEAVANMNEIIEALEKIDQEQCEDCISRSDVEDAMYDATRAMDLNYGQIMEYIDKIPSVTTQPCEDCVSRQAVLDLVADYDLSIGQVVKGIHALPSVTSQPKMGRWITWKEAGNDIPSETRFECSVCHDAAQTLCNGLDLLSTYCPNCGAKMQEVEG